MTAEKKLTPAQMKALRFLVEKVPADTLTGIVPRQLAEHMWPDSPGWRRMSGAGTTRGGGCLGKNMPRLGAKLLWALKRIGYAELRGTFTVGVDSWHPTSAGRLYAEKFL